jgi:hypothetical protein
MKKYLTLTAIGILLLAGANAQVRFGIRAGANFSKWVGDDLQVIEDLLEKTGGYVTTKGKTGFHAGAYVHIPISEHFSFEPGLLYSKKGYSIKGDVQVEALKLLALNAGLQVQSHYIDLPLHVVAKVAGGLNIYGGPQVSFLTRSTLNAKLGILGISIFNRGFGITERFNRVDLGLSGGIGYAFDNGLNFRAGYEYGLSKLDKNDNYDAYNRVVKVSMGYTF